MIKTVSDLRRALEAFPDDTRIACDKIGQFADADGPVLVVMAMWRPDFYKPEPPRVKLTLWTKDGSQS